MTNYVRVSSEGAVRRFPLTEEDGPLALSVLRTRFPIAQGLSYSDGDDQVVVPSQDDVISPPLDGWSGRLYTVLTAEGTPTKVKSEQVGPQLVMAPERSLHLMESRRTSGTSSPQWRALSKGMPSPYVKGALSSLTTCGVSLSSRSRPLSLKSSLSRTYCPS